MLREPVYTLGFLAFRPKREHFRDVYGLMKGLTEREEEYQEIYITTLGIGSSNPKNLCLKVDGKPLEEAYNEVNQLVGKKCITIGKETTGQIIVIERGEFIQTSLEDSHLAELYDM